MEYWVWLQSVLRFSNGRFITILDRFGSAKQVFESDISVLQASGLFTLREIKEASLKSLSKSLKIIESCRKSDIKILPYGSEGYPDCLLNIADPPIVVYYKGTLPDFDNVPSVCIVGPRKCSDFGIKASYSLSARLSRGGFLVVSGGAVGVDSAAHKGAMTEKAATVAVLPCGIEYDYLKVNEHLREEIIHKNGCLLSEFPPDFPVIQGAFQIRNRIMSALALGTVVIEADERSGALITARHAAEQGKDVFVIPGNPTLTQYIGSNALLRDGAKPLLSALDVFYEYIGMYADKLDIEKAFSEPINSSGLAANKTCGTVSAEVVAAPKSGNAIGVSEIANAVYAAIPDEAFCIDELGVFNDYNATELMTAVAELELFGYVKAVPGGRYVRIK